MSQLNDLMHDQVSHIPNMTVIFNITFIDQWLTNSQMIRAVSIPSTILNLTPHRGTDRVDQITVEGDPDRYDGRSAFNS